ncbi:D-tagatose-1,6-bisphosphate aldolase subunit GatZ [Klebsiella pneumoniae]|nr:D-tagatose-1,6-bisphosphate aldolase subunit GatZ [Klebsiella pneumoniae]
MKDIITRHKSGEHIGICSVCSAHPLVIEAALRFDLSTNNKVLIEATSNVNQFGGYTGMQPADFRDFTTSRVPSVFRRSAYSWRRPSWTELLARRTGRRGDGKINRPDQSLRRRRL